MTDEIRELNSQIVDLQNGIQTIDHQLTCKKAALRRKLLDGTRTPQDVVEYEQWKINAIKAKICKNNLLRQTKESLRVVMNEYNRKFSGVGFWLCNEFKTGTLHVDSGGYYFTNSDGELTDYFDTIPELIAHLKGE